MARLTVEQEKLKEAYDEPAYGDAYTRHPFGLLLTPGMVGLANAGAWWLVDAIASYCRKEEFQIWTLTVDRNAKAILTMKEDTDQPVLVSQEIPYTDFPDGEWKFYLEYRVLMIPSER